VGRFRTRRLDTASYPYVFLDATYLHVPGGGLVTSKAVVVATGVTGEGRREILGVDVGDSEDEVFWRTFLTHLKSRGLAGVRLVISDQHAGLVAAISRSFQGAAHQRCRVHFARNLLALVPKNQMDMVAALFRPIFAQPDAEAVAACWEQVRDQLAARIPKIGPYMDDAKAEVLAFAKFPRAHWRKIWSTNPLERLNKESNDEPASSASSQRSLRHPLGRHDPDRHQRRMDHRRTPLPLRRIHGAPEPHRR